MTIEALEEALRKKAPEGQAERALWNDEIDRLIRAMGSIQCPAELAEGLSPSPRYVGTRPWLDAIVRAAERDGRG